MITGYYVAGFAVIDMNIENSSIPSIRFAAFSMMLLMLINPISMGEVFPSDPFNGLQVSYTISGATLDTPEDAEGFTFLRSIKGVLESDELTVSGVAKATNGWGATIDVSVGVDGEEPKTFHEEKFPEEGLMPDPMSQPFTVTVPIPAEAESASFSISLSGSYNAGSRGVVVEGTLDRSNSSSSSQNGKTYCCAGSCSHKKWWSESGSSQDSGEKLRIMADSGVRFSGLTGQVDIRPDGDEDAWRGAGLKSIINQNDHIRTGEESRAILSFPDMTTFDLRPESEVIVDTPAEKDSKVSLVCGKIWTNFKKMLKDGTMEVQMSQAVAGIKGTTIVCEETGDSSALKVLDGKASFKSKATGEEILVRAGEMVTATESGLSKIQSFDVEAENASFGPYAPVIEAVESKESRVIYNSWNLGFVDDAPTCSPFFTINEPQMITYIDTYHRNLGQDAPGGTIGLRGGDGTLYGPWEAATSLDQGDMDKGYWIVHPNEVIPSGTYTIEDSDPETWSKNSESPCGFAKVEGYPVESSASQERGVPVAGTKETGSSAAPPKTGSSYSATGIADSAIQSSQERGSVAQEEIADAGTNSYTADKATSSPAKEDLAAAWPESVLMGESAYADASAQSIKIRGQVATGNFKWTAQNFAGFYYDPKNDMGTEVLTATLMDGRLSGSHPFGLYYQTTAQRQDFDFQEWGSYLVLGFLGEKHFAGYLGGSDSENGYLFDQSGDKSILAKGQLLEILADDDDRDFFTATTITTNTPLQLKEGYELSIKSIDIDGNVVDLELTHDGSAVDSAKVSPSRDGATIADQTYLYKKDIGELKDVVVIAIHFKNAFRGADSDLATVDGIWQLSENPIKVSSGTKYEKMVVSSVTDNAVIMNNQGSDIALSRNKEIPIMPGIIIRTADADELRYCVFRELTKPGTYELRGSVAIDSNAWNAQNFSGFYYDIDGDIQTEELTATITSGNFVEPGGLTYSTSTLADDFEFEDWGSYEVMGFLGEKCFAGYIEGSDSGEGYLFEKSTIKNALAEGQIMKVLADDDTERTITSNTSLMLAENFSLELKAVNPNDGKVLIELHRDDHLVADWIIQPSKEDAGISDQTIFYRNPQVGSQKNLVTIAVHFKDAFKGADQDLATVDGVWQISEFPISVAEGTAFDRLVISNVMPDQILMENMNGPITLSGNKDMTLAGDISIKTADSDSLRYYIHRDVEITELTTSPTDLFTGITRKSVTTLEKPVLPGAQNLDESSGKVAETGDPVQRLKALKELMDAGLITEEEYADRKAEILATV
jgi:S-layer protein (TIGR01567 family)